MLPHCGQRPLLSRVLSAPRSASQKGHRIIGNVPRGLSRTSFGLISHKSPQTPCARRPRTSDFGGCKVNFVGPCLLPASACSDCGGGGPCTEEKATCSTAIDAGGGSTGNEGRSAYSFRRRLS